jgi:Zn-dependent protease/CBS domain-containing protein
VREARRLQCRPGMAHEREARGVKRGVFLFRIAGIRIHIDYSWLVIFLLVLWSLSVGYFPSAVPGGSALAYWAAGLAATLLLFASILVHELSHALVARRSGIEIPAITLFLLGGIAHMSEEPRDAATELKVGGVGPLTSFVLAAFFWAVYAVYPGDSPSLGRSLVGYLAAINAALGVFNLLPGYPLDGGRVLRAVEWWRTGSLRHATRIASNAGQGLAIGLMVLGALNLFAGGLVGGLWLILLGLFLRGMAIAGFQETVLRRVLEDVSVADVMVRDVVTVPRELPVRSLIDDYLLAYGYRGFPVVENGHVTGVISFRDVKQVPEQDRARVTVGESMRPIDRSVEITPDAALLDALRQMAEEHTDRLLVMRNGALAGMITKTALHRFVELRDTLG